MNETVNVRSFWQRIERSIVLAGMNRGITAVFKYINQIKIVKRIYLKSTHLRMNEKIFKMIAAYVARRFMKLILFYRYYLSNFLP